MTGKRESVVGLQFDNWKPGLGRVAKESPPTYVATHGSEAGKPAATAQKRNPLMGG